MQFELTDSVKIFFALPSFRGYLGSIASFLYYK